MLSARTRLYVVAPVSRPRDLLPESWEVLETNEFVQFVLDTGGDVLPLYSHSAWPAPARFDLTSEYKAKVKVQLDILYKEIGAAYRMELDVGRPVEKLTGARLELDFTQREMRKHTWKLLFQTRLLPCSGAGFRPTN